MLNMSLKTKQLLRQAHVLVSWPIVSAFFTKSTYLFLQGPSFPSMHPMIAKWIPPTERSTISALVYGGNYSYMFHIE